MMDIPIQAGLSASPIPVESVSPVSQNLFEAMAMQARDQQFMNMGPVGQALAGHLDTYLERTNTFSERVKQISNGEPVYQDKAAPAQAGPGAGDQRVMTVLQSLSTMFDYSIETQVVVRSATQISGAVNTLLRGQ